MKWITGQHSCSIWWQLLLVFLLAALARPLVLHSAETTYATPPIAGVWMKTSPSLAEMRQAQTQPKKKSNLGFNPCSCISFVRWKSGINVGPVGVAKKHPVNTQEPIVGAIMILNGKTTGHALFVEEVREDDVVASDCNSDNKCKCGTQIIKKDDQRIKGFYVQI